MEDTTDKRVPNEQVTSGQKNRTVDLDTQEPSLYTVDQGHRSEDFCCIRTPFFHIDFTAALVRANVKPLPPDDYKQGKKSARSVGSPNYANVAIS